MLFHSIIVWLTLWIVFSSSCFFFFSVLMGKGHIPGQDCSHLLSSSSLLKLSYIGQTQVPNCRLEYSPALPWTNTGMGHVCAKFGQPDASSYLSIYPGARPAGVSPKHSWPPLDAEVHSKGLKKSSRKIHWHLNVEILRIETPGIGFPVWS